MKTTETDIFCRVKTFFPFRLGEMARASGCQIMFTSVNLLL